MRKTAIIICSIIAFLIIFFQIPESAKAWSALTMSVGEVKDLSYIISTTPELYYWDSSNSNVVQILTKDKMSCRIIARSVGTTYVVCEYGSTYLHFNNMTNRWENKFTVLGNYTWLITVAQPPTGIDMPGSLSIVVGDSYTITPSFVPSGSSSDLTWISGNNGIAEVSNGKITTKAVGNVNITAITANNLIATCQVTVRKPDKPTLEKTRSLQYNSIEVLWRNTNNAEGYAIYRKTGNSEWTKLASVKQGVASYTDNPVICGQSYTYMIRAYRTIGTNKVYSDYDTAGITGKAIPAAPVLSAFTFSDSQGVKLSWDKINGATKFEVYRSINGNSFELIKTVSATTLVYKDISLPSSTIYYYKVRALREENGKSIGGKYSNTLTVKPQTKMTIHAESAGYDRIVISWNKVAGASGYKVYRSLSSSGIYTKVGDISDAQICTYTNKGLIIGISYYYKVRPFIQDSGKNIYGAYSSIASAKPIPATPDITSAASVEYNKIKITWQAVTGADGYKVYRASSIYGDYSIISSVLAGSNFSITDEGLVTGNAYYYKVRAYTKVDNANIYSGYSSIVKAVPIPAKPELTANNVGFGKVKLSWKRAPGAEGYVVYRSTSMNGTYDINKKLTDGELTDYIDSAASSDQESYCYKIRAFCKVGVTNVYSNYSAIVNAKTLPNPPNLTATPISSDSVELSWTKVEGALGYQFYWKPSTLSTLKL